MKQHRSRRRAVRGVAGRQARRSPNYGHSCHAQPTQHALHPGTPRRRLHRRPQRRVLPLDLLRSPPHPTHRTVPPQQRQLQAAPAAVLQRLPALVGRSSCRLRCQLRARLLQGGLRWGAVPVRRVR